MNRRHVATGMIALLATVPCGLAAAQATEPVQASARQLPSDAWWTGPMLANSAATLPRGHFLIEPYLFDVHSSGYFDQGGVRRRVPRSDSYGSLTYMLYGIADRVSVGLVPTFSFTTVSGGSSSSGVGVGDLSVMAQFRLTANDPYSRVPTISINIQETLPTGKYDRLGRPTDGAGSGAYATTVALYSQKYLWLPNGRIMRMRLNVSETFSGRATIEDASVYGTEQGFRGSATPGPVLFINGAWEYSVTRHWVLALDATYRHAGNTDVTGYTSGPGAVLAPPSVTSSGTSDAVGLAPAIEYNVTGNFGVLVGARVIAAGRNTSASITPAIAFNIVH